MADVDVTLPAGGWHPRDYQTDLWQYLEAGGTRAFTVWHRRSGKDDVGLHWTCSAAHQRIGTYWYMLPEQAQGKKAIWEAIDEDSGQRRIDVAFPAELRERSNSQEMFIKFKNGSTWQVVGSDNYNSLVGSPPVGIVASEWALAKPAAWAYLRPILRKNGGWALFNTTPRGKNHAHRMYEGFRTEPGAFAQLLDAKHTSVFTPEQLVRELAEYKRDFGEAVGTQMFDQEYMCSFEQPVVGAIFPAELKAAREAKRIRNVPHDPMLPVQTWWDIGGAGKGGDATAVWFVQLLGPEIRLIRYYEQNGQPFSHFVNVLEELTRSQNYRYSRHWFPHDSKAVSLQTGMSLEEMAAEFLVGDIELVPAMNVEDRINAARMIFARCYFDTENTSEGVDALTNFRREWVDKLMQTAAQPLHDWSSHGSDAFTYMALSLRDAMPKPKPKKLPGHAQPGKRMGVWG